MDGAQPFLCACLAAASGSARQLNSLLPMAHPRYHALSRCTPFPLLHTERPQTLTIHSVYRQAINLRTPDDRWLALVVPELGNGPFHLVVPPSALAGLVAGETVQLEGEILQFPNRQIDFRHARSWSAMLPTQPTLARFSVNEWLYVNVQTIHSPLWAASATPLTTLAQQGWSSLQQGLQQGDADQLAAGAARLAGLGPGLTPAGDDFLLGWLAGIWSGALEGITGWTPQATGKIVAQAAIPRTTRLSSIWLSYAAAGEFSEPWHNLIQALRQPEEAPRQQAWQRILHSGATSGHDALAGFCRAWAIG